MASSSFSLPLCDDEFFDVTGSSSEWFECQCGIFYNVNTIRDYNRALDALASADSMAAEIEDRAELQDADYRASASGAVPTSVAASVMTTAATVPTTNWVAAEVAQVRKDANKAPVRSKTARPNRVLPKLTPQQTLLTVAATLIVVALSIFFGSTWNELNLGVQALILLVIVASTAFGSIKSKKYFVIISNFLAALSSAFLALGFAAAGTLGLLDDFIPDVMNAQTSFYPTFILLATGAYSLVMGRRFKIFGWLAFAPVMMALSGMLSSAATLPTFVGDSQTFIGYTLTSLSVSLLLVIAIGRLTRLPQPAAATAKKSKKQPTESDEEIEQKYQLELHTREQNALIATYRLGVWATAAAGVLLAINLPIRFLGAILGNGIFPDALALAVLGAFWFGVSVFIQNRGAAYTVAGEVSPRIKLVSWTLGFVSLAISASTLMVQLDREADRYATLLPVVANALIGAGMLFVIGNKLSEKFHQARRASVTGATVTWALYALLAPWSNMFSNLAALWFAIVAAALFAKAWQSGSRALAYASLVLASFAAITPSLVSDTVAPTAASIALQASISALGLALTYAAITKLKEKVTVSGLFVGVFYLASNALIVALALYRWFGVADVRTDASQPALLMALAAVFATATALGSLSKFVSKHEVQAALMAGVSALWSLAGFVVIAPTTTSLTSMRADLGAALSVYSVVIFSVSTYFASRSKLAVSPIFAMVFGTAMAVALGRSSFDLTAGLAIASPLLFLGTSLTVAVIIKKFASKLHALSPMLAAGSFAISWFAYLFLKTTALYDGPLAAINNDATAQLTNATASMVVYLGFAFVLLLARLRKPFAADQFYNTFLLATGSLSLLGALLAASSVMGEPASLWLIAITLFSATVLVYVTASIEKTTAWLYATYALALSTAVAIQCAAIPSASISVSGVWLNVLIPMNMVLVLLVHLAMGRLAKRVGVSFGWNILPISTVAASALALVSPIFTSIYVPADSAGSFIADNGWTAVMAYSLVGVIYLGWRVAKKQSQDFERALLASSLVGLVFGVVAIFNMRDIDQTAQLYTLFGAFAVMFLLQAFAKREVRTNFYGSALLVASSWMLVWYQFSLTNNDAVLAEYFSVPSLAIFVLSTWLRKRADKAANLKSWWPLMPALFAVGTLIGSVAFTILPGATVWLEFAISLAIGVVALFASSMKALKTPASLRYSVAAVALVSWAVSLRMSLLETSAVTTGDTPQLRQMILALVVGTSVLVYSQIMKVRAFFFAGFALATIAGAATGAYLIQSIVFEGSELYWTPIAVALAVSALVGYKQGFLPQRLKSLLTTGAPLLAIILSSTAVSWLTVNKPIATLDSMQLTRLLALAIGGAVLLTLGLRMGNLGVTVAGGSALGLTLVPNVWFRIEDAFSGRSAIELKALFVGLLAYILFRAILAITKLELRSIVWVGIPVAIAMVPAVLDLLAALPQDSLTTEDWIRFGIVLGGSALMLVLGALRRIGGLFVPGAIGVVVSALPYAWKQVTAQTWGLWVVLILVAALLVFVAIRLEQFKNGSKSASNWMKELR